MMDIHIEKYNQIEIRNKNLISLSIFKMKGPYRSFDKYINYLKNLINNFYVKARDSNFDIRIYFDDSCANDLHKLIHTFKDIEFYKYNYEPLRIDEFHNGTFGSIIRLLPIFNKEDFSYEYIWIDDIDIYQMDFNLIKIMKEKKINSLIYSMFCYYRPWIKSKYALNFPLITNIKLDIKMLMNFLDDLVNKKYKKEINEIILYRNDRYKYDYDIKFPYGMDEYFTNNIIYKDLIKHDMYVNYDYDISRILKKISLSNLIKDKRDQDIINQLMKIGEILWKTDNFKIKNEIIYTFIKLLNRIEIKKMKYYFSLVDEELCLDEFYDYLKNIDLKKIINFHKIIHIKNVI